MIEPNGNESVLDELNYSLPIEDILDERARILATESEDSKAESQTPYLIFQTGSSEYGILANKISSVVSVSVYTQMEGAPEIANSIFSVRGAIYSGIRLDKAVGKPSNELQSKAIILKNSDLTILCERFLGIIDINDKEVVIRSSDDNYFCGILPGRIMLVDGEKLIATVSDMFG